MLRELRSAILPPRVIAKVNTVNSDGTVTATTDSGRTHRATGSSTIGNYVYIQDGRVLGEAPDLPHHDIVI